MKITDRQGLIAIGGFVVLNLAILLFFGLLVQQVVLWSVWSVVMTLIMSGKLK